LHIKNTNTTFYLGATGGPKRLQPRTKKENAMKKFLAVAASALTLSATPALAAPSNEPVKLTDAELDAVTAGEALLDVTAPINVLLKDITVAVSIQNVPVNAGLAVQLNALGTAMQTASVTAYQNVTQLAQ
jgi:hypothetical protein